MIRHEIWHALERDGVAVGPAWSMIPNFVGADTAAWRLAHTDAWRRAKTVKTNPDHPQIPIRIRALYDGKVVYTPVPYLTREFPYLRLDPEALTRKGVSFELAATAEGFMQHGERLEFEQVEPLDFCVVGSVAVSRAGGPARVRGSPTSKPRSSANSASSPRRRRLRPQSTRCNWSRAPPS